MRFRCETKYDADKQPIIHLHEYTGDRRVSTRLLTWTEAEEIRSNIAAQQRIHHARFPRHFGEVFDGKAAAAGERP